MGGLAQAAWSPCIDMRRLGAMPIKELVLLNLLKDMDLRDNIGSFTPDILLKYWIFESIQPYI